MTNHWQIVGWTLVLVTLPGTLELLFLTLAGLLPYKKRETKRKAISLVVVVPAHDEEGTIGRCVESLLACEPPRGGVRIVVVADNCTDETAAEAREAGAEVFVRDEPTRHGKGFALDFAFRRLVEDAAVDAVVVVDADTVVEPHMLRHFASMFGAGIPAVQCRYRVRNAQAGVFPMVSEVALTAFNVVRPRGRDRFGLSVGLAGNGFGLATRLLRAVPFQAGSIVEDMEYHLRLVRAGYKVAFLDTTTVRAEIPTRSSGARTQHARWEGGRLRMALTHGPGMLRDVLRGRLRVIEPLLELMLLPLALHMALLVGAAAMPGSAELLSPLRVAALCGMGVVLLHVLSAIWIGRLGLQGLVALSLVPFYAAWKLVQIPAIWRASRRDAAWVRTERELPNDGRNAA